MTAFPLPHEPERERDSAQTPPHLSAAPAVDPRVESYRRLADVFHELLAEESLDALLERIADALEDLVPHDTLTIYEADEARGLLTPVLARDEYAEEIMSSVSHFGRGITGWAVANREPVHAPNAHLDPRVEVVPGTPADDAEALVTIPLIARGAVKGALNMYRLGADARFTDDEFELARRFADAAALALDNAHVRARLQHQAQTDSLTGLYNHRYFHERLREELKRAGATGSTVGVVMFDIDDFKKVNDVYGHGTGDELLRGLADSLAAAVRTEDVVCRVGGEEFGVILTDCRPADALGLARRLAAALSATEVPIVGSSTVSVGLALGPEHAMNPRELVACAEAAMMAAKAGGKDQVVLFGDTKLDRPDAERSELRSIAHLKLLQSLGGKLNRLNDVREIGAVIANELRALIDYHNCRVFVVDGDRVVPIAFRGEFAGDGPDSLDALACRVGEGLTGRVALTGEPLLLRDAASYEFALRVEGTEDIDESVVAVPLLYGSVVSGVVVISKLGLAQFDEDDVRLLEVLAGHAAVALENARLYESQRREAQSATALLEFGRELAGTTGLDATLSRIVERTASILGSPRTSVWLQNPATLELRAVAEHGHDPAHRARLFEAHYPAELAEGFLHRSDPFTLSPEALASLPGVPPQEYGFAVAPIVLEGDRVGCIAAEEPPDRKFSDRDLRLLGGLAHQSKLAITNAGTIESLEETFVSTVEALANALEANDEYTSSHARWITDLAIQVGAELGLEVRALKRLELGALFHDIGKIGIPSEILGKPGRLTAEERRIVETHPELGERILGPIERLHDVGSVVRSCHERWDGEGYPDGKAGEEIPVEARIVFVCDAFHAMTTDRPYRRRLSTPEACRRLEVAAGTQFDPRIVETFLRLVLDGRASTHD
jgi:diguanylate cyclase (GGDEF)-like protein